MKQREIDWQSAQALAHLRRCGVPELAAQLAVLICQRGEKREIEGELRMELTASKRQLANDLRCSPNGITKAADCRALRGCLKRLVLSGRTTFVLSLDRLSELEPATSRLDQALFQDGWSPVVTGGHSSPTVSFNKNNSLQCPCTSGESDSVSVAAEVTSGDHPRPYFAMPEGGGLTDAEVRQAIDDPELTLIRDVFEATCRWDRCRRFTDRTDWDQASRFLSIWHHAATSPGDYNAAALLVSRVRNGDCRRLSDDSKAWAKAKLRATAAAQT